MSITPLEYPEHEPPLTLPSFLLFAGLVAHAFARLATSLKFTLDPNLLATNPASLSDSSNRVDRGLALAEGAMTEGRLNEAAGIVEAAVEGTAAEAAAREWVSKVRERAVAEQSLELLRAHAAALVHAA